MGIVFSSRIARICIEDDEIPARLLLVGLDSSGKSTLLRRLENLVQIQLDPKVNLIENIPTTPTFVYQVETINMPLAPLPLNIWDLGGKARQLWKFYLTGVEGVIFVIDSNDRDRFIVAREELIDLSQQLDEQSNVLMIVAANKQDVHTSLSSDALRLALSLPNLIDLQWKFFEISAQTGAGVLELFSNLSQMIHQRRIN